MQPPRVRVSGFHLLIGLSYAGFALAKLAIFQIDADRVLPDTFGYVRVAEADLGQSSFWLGERPPTIPLIYKVFGLDSETLSDPVHRGRVTLFQLGLATLAWGALAGLVAWASKGRFQRAAALLLTLAFGVTLDIAYWDRMLLSESISTSLFALLIAGWVLGIRFWGGFQQRGRPVGWALYLAGITALTVLFSFTRDANAYLLGAASLLLLVGILTRQVRRRPVHWGLTALALVMVLTSALHNHTIAVSKRWLGPLLNVFSARILRDKEAVSFFAARGLPTDAITEEMGLGRSAFLSQLERVDDGLRLKQWFEQHGRPAYIQFLVSRPIESLTGPLAELPQLIRPDSSEYRLPQRPDPVWAQVIRTLFYPQRLRFVAVLVLLPAIAIGLAPKGRRLMPVLLPAIGLLILAYPLALVVWHGDAIELERHSHHLAVQVRLAGWLLVIAALHRG